jgi:hypothetical protein
MLRTCDDFVATGEKEPGLSRMSPSLDRANSTRSPYELKFMLSREMGEQIRAWAREFMQPDPHGDPTLGHAYHVRSLYLDTPDLDVFQQKGSYARGKYRIRQYLPAGLVFLERKLKSRGIVRKRRTQTALDELALLSETPTEGWHGFWYQRRIEARRLQPICQIGYLRYAFVAGDPSEPLRLTLDEQMQASPTREFKFNGETDSTRVLPENSVLELKYLCDTPVLFKNLLDRFKLTPQPVSKYRSALPALGIARAPEEKPVTAS